MAHIWGEKGRMSSGFEECPSHSVIRSRVWQVIVKDKRRRLTLNHAALIDRLNGKDGSLVDDDEDEKRWGLN